MDEMVDAKDTTSPRPSSHFVSVYPDAQAHEQIDDCPRGSILLIQTPPGTHTFLFSRRSS